MNNGIVPTSPSYFRNPSHLAKYNVYVFYILNSLVFKDAIRDTSPSVIKGKLYFNSEFTQGNVWECLSLRIEIHLEWANFIQHLPNSVLELWT